MSAARPTTHDNPAGARSCDRADRAGGRPAPPDPRLAVAVARRGADRPARAREARRPAPPRRDGGGQPAALLPPGMGLDARGGDERGRAAAAVGAVRDRARPGGVRDRPPARRAAGGGGAGRARRRAPAARLLLAGGARLRGGRAGVRARVPVLPRRARAPAAGGAVVGARLGRRARLPLLRDLPGRDRGGDPARAPRPRRAARARRRRAGRRVAAAAAVRADRRRPHRECDGRHGPGRAREGRRDELVRGRARSGDRQPRVAGRRAAARRRGPRRAPPHARGDPPRGGRRRRGGADRARRARRRRLPQQPQHAAGARDRARGAGARVRRGAARGRRARRRRVRGDGRRHDRRALRSRARARGLAGHRPRPRRDPGRRSWRRPTPTCRCAGTARR